MKYLHRACMALALALGSIAASVAHAAERVGMVVYHSQTNDFGRAVAEFKADLTYQAGLSGEVAQTVDAGLTRDSHGFRQVTANFQPGNLPTC